MINDDSHTEYLKEKHIKVNIFPNGVGAQVVLLKCFIITISGSTWAMVCILLCGQ